MNAALDSLKTDLSANIEPTDGTTPVPAPITTPSPPPSSSTEALPSTPATTAVTTDPDVPYTADDILVRNSRRIRQA